MNGLTWQKCCEEAIDYGSALGLKLTYKARTVMEWYCSFQVRRKLARPPRKKHKLPPFLQLNPDVCSAIQQYGRAHLVDLGIEMMVENIHGIVLPKIVAEEAKMSIEECDETFDPLLDQGLVEVRGCCCYLLLLFEKVRADSSSFKLNFK